MRLAVEQGDPDVDDGITGVYALFHLSAHALLDAGDELARHRAPDHLVAELEPGPFGQRFDLDVADRVLTVATGLFDVPAVAFRLAAKGFSQRYPQLDGIHADAVPVGQCVQHHTGMGLAPAPQHDLVRLRVLLDPQCRVLGS